MTRADPRHAAVARAAHLVDLARYDEAEALLHDAIAAEPHEPRLFCELSRCYYAADRYLDAVNSADRAIVLDPEDGWPQRLRALALVQMKKGKAAVASAQSAVRLDGDEYAYIVLTRALMLIKDWKGAYKAAYVARDLAPESAEVHANLGFLSLRRERWSDAEAHLRRALELDPTNAETINNLGVALNARGRSAEALKMFAASSRTDPRVSEGRENAVRTARRFGGLGVVLAVWFVFRTLTMLGREGIRPDGRANELSIIAGIFVCALALALFVYVRTRNKAKGLDPALVRFLKEQQLARVGLGPRAHEHVWGRIAGITIALGFGTMAGVLLFLSNPPPWRIGGAVALTGALTLLVAVVRSWRPRGGSSR